MTGAGHIGTHALAGLLAFVAAACSDDGASGQTGQLPGGSGTTGNAAASAEDDDGIDPSVPTASSPGTGADTTGGQDITAGAADGPTGPTGEGSDAGDITAGTSSGTGGTGASGTTGAGSSDSGASTEGDGLTFGTGGTEETLEFSDERGLPTFGDTGTPATNCVSIDVPADGYDVVVAVQLEVAFTHTWIGDVTIALSAPDDTTLTVLNRPGHPGGNFGDDSDAAASSPLTFDDDAVTSAEQMGAVLGPALVVCGSDDICDFSPAPDAAGTGGATGTSFADFTGVAADGQWLVCFTDSADEDPLTVSGATLRITKSM